MIPDELQVPGYDIEERIGKGGMASVYRARQHTFDRHVALKVLKPDLSEDESFCQRFVQESLIVAKLHHSNIVQVYDVGEFQNNFFIAMEYLNGGDLNSRLSKGIAIRDTVTIIKQAASALDFAHQKGIIHRDIKPDNIMFREDGAAVLTDFGIAKELDSDMNLTQTGLIVGTPKYMAPEQIRGDVASAQADIYALGILLFQCLTDHVPFEGKDMVATAYKHFNEPVPALPPLIAAFQPILEKMLAKKVEDRFERALDIVTALEELSGEDKGSEKTNLELTKEYDKPGSNLDPTVVHAYNQDTVIQPGGDDDETAQMTVSPELVDGDATQVTSSEPAPTTTASRTKIIAVTMTAVFITAVIALWLVSKPSDPSLPELAELAETQPEAPIDTPQAPVTQEQPAEITEGSDLNELERLTIDRLITEAKQDIEEQRLKKPDSNNAFNKLQRVLAMDPQNPMALAGLEQIAEEYAKIAERSIEKRQYQAAGIFLNDARSASPELNLIAVIQSKLDAARSKESAAKASILSMERSLKIDGLLKGAAIDEEEGRLRTPFDDNALDKYLRVLELDPKNALALQKVEELKP